MVRQFGAVSIGKNCKKSDEAIVVMKRVKARGAKGRNTNAFSDRKYA